MKNYVSILLLFFTAAQAYSGGSVEPPIKEGSYILPLRLENPENNPAHPLNSEESVLIDLRSEAALGSFAYLAVELSRTSPDYELTGIYRAYSLIQEGYDITLICRCRNRGEYSTLLAVIHYAENGEKSVVKKTFHYDFTP